MSLVPKKPKVNRSGPYALFMLLKKREFEAAGSTFPNGLSDLVEICSEAWQNLPEDQRERYKNRAKANRERASGQTSIEVIPSDPRPGPMREFGSRHKTTIREGVTSFGVSIDEVMCTALSDQDYEFQMLRNIRALVSTKDGNDPTEHEYIFLHFNWYCVTDGFEYIPCEVGLTSFSIQRGVTDNFGTLIDPGQIPLGCGFEAMTKANKYGIPEPPFHEAAQDLERIWMAIRRFIRQHPTTGTNKYYVFCKREDTTGIQGCLDWFVKVTGIPIELEIYLYSMSLLVQQLSVAGAELHKEWRNETAETSSGIGEHARRYYEIEANKRFKMIEIANKQLQDAEATLKKDQQEQPSTSKGQGRPISPMGPPSSMNTDQPSTSKGLTSRPQPSPSTTSIQGERTRPSYQSETDEDSNWRLRLEYDSIRGRDAERAEESSSSTNFSIFRPRRHQQQKTFVRPKTGYVEVTPSAGIHSAIMIPSQDKSASAIRQAQMTYICGTGKHSFTLPFNVEAQSARQLANYEECLRTCSPLTSVADGTHPLEQLLPGTTASDSLGESNLTLKYLKYARPFLFEEQARDFLDSLDLAFMKELGCAHHIVNDEGIKYCPLNMLNRMIYGALDVLNPIFLIPVMVGMHTPLILRRAELRRRRTLLACWGLNGYKGLPGGDKFKDSAFGIEEGLLAIDGEGEYDGGDGCILQRYVNFESKVTQATPSNSNQAPAPSVASSSMFSNFHWTGPDGNDPNDFSNWFPGGYPNPNAIPEEEDLIDEPMPDADGGFEDDTAFIDDEAEPGPDPDPNNAQQPNWP